MKRIPKTPIEFDYDLWTTEDGKCMVRVKRTGEVSEVDREVMKVLRAEEKKLRRSYGADSTSEDENGEKSSDSVLSLDALPDDGWLIPKIMQKRLSRIFCWKISSSHFLRFI